MVGPDDSKIVIDQFGGRYDRGNVSEVPPDHAQDCRNLVFTSKGTVKTRQGLTKSLTLGHAGGIRRFFLMTWSAPNVNQSVPTFPSATEGEELLTLDNSGNLYIGNYGTPIKTISGMADFAALNLGNRVYVSPNNGASGFRAGRLQVLNPADGSIRDAAGLAPAQSSSLLAATSSGTAGVVPAGLHKITVLFETDTGFWTPPGPKLIQGITPAASTTTKDPTIITLTNHGLETGESHRISGATGNWTPLNDVWYVTRLTDNTFSVPLNSNGFGAPAGTIVIDGVVTPATVTVDGTKKIAVTNIPTGPTGTVKRILLATRANEEEFFFVPNVPGCLSEINDNTTTTATLDFSDTDLIDSADYLFDIMEVVPGGGGISKYRSRMVISGSYFPGNAERVILSHINDPETFNYVSGYIQVQSERDGNNVNNCFVLRDTLYMNKFTGMFATEDNGLEPSTWGVSVVDAVVGTYGHGTSTFTESQPSPDTGDIVILASRPGLYLFDGVVRRPELSYKIQSLWLRINFAAFFRVTVAHDPWNHKIYISAPLDSATEPNVLLVCDYSDGRSADQVRWDTWYFHKNPSCIGMMYFGTSTSPTFYTLKIGSLDSSTPYLYTLTDGQLSDDGTAIVSYYKPGPLTVVKGALNTFKMLIFQATGVGTLALTLTKENDTGSVTPTALTLATAPGRNLQRQINFVNEEMNLKIQNGATLNDYMILERIDIWGIAIWPVRPGV